MKLLRLAWRQLWREARSGELRVLAAALMLAVAASSAIGHFTERLNGAMLLRATEFLGADLALTGSAPLTEAQRALTEGFPLQQAQVVEFSSMLGTADSMQLASVKAVSGSYPLRGALKSRVHADGPEISGERPSPGEIWLEARLLHALDVDIGETLELGYASLTVTRILTHEPDRSADFYSLTPRALFNLADLSATQVVQPGSRVRYSTLLAGVSQDLSAYQRAVQKTLLPQQRLRDAKDGNRQVGRALSRAQSYLNLTSLLAIVLCAVAVALSASRFASRRFDASALLRCLGLSRGQTLTVYALQLLLLASGACLLGAAIGLLAQEALVVLLKGLLPPSLPGISLKPALAGIATGLITLAGFAIAPLWALGQVPPIRVLRRDTLPVALSTWFSYSAAIGALAFLLWRLSLDGKMTLSLLAGALLASVLLGGMLLALLKLVRTLLADASLPWRLGVGQLLRHPLAAAGQSLAFGLILLAMALIALLRTELLDTWQAQLPARAPNHFALNIQPHEQANFTQAVANASGETPVLYPIVQGRLSLINGAPVREAVSKEANNEGALRRDLSLTWAAHLPKDNTLLAGTWWTPNEAQPTGVSVEAELAKRLGLSLGDNLTFTIAGAEYKASIQSIRQVKWDNFAPNFYMVFAPNSLREVPVSYLTSFYLDPTDPAALLALSRAFPSVTLLEVEGILKQLRSIIAQVSLAVEYVLLFILAAGFCVLFAGLQATLDERLRQGALLRALGATQHLVKRARYLEFALLGALAGLLAAVGCELISWVLYRFVLELSWQWHPWVWLLPVLGAGLICLAGLWGTRKALSASPLDVLRQP